MYGRQGLQLENSKIKTQYSAGNEGSIQIQNEANEARQKMGELKHLSKWIGKYLTCSSAEPHLSQLSSAYSYFMIKLESMQSLSFRRRNPKSKVCVHIVSKLYNSRTGQQYKKMSHTIKTLDEDGVYIFSLKESLTYYFYTSRQQQIVLRIEVFLGEMEAISQSALFYGALEQVGAIQIDFIKERKGKEKAKLVQQTQLWLQTEGTKQQGGAASASMTYSVSKSQAYKLMETVVQQNVLCDPSDKIPGVLGYCLPTSDTSVVELFLTPEAQSLHLEFAAIQINSQIFKESAVQGEMIAKSRFGSASRLSCKMKDVLLNVSFHNGWKKVSKAEIVLEERMNHGKTEQSQLLQLEGANTMVKSKRRKQNTSILILDETPLNKKSKTRHFTAEKAINLSMVFPQEQECALIIQIEVCFVISGQYQAAKAKQDKQNKKDTKESNAFTEQIRVEVCYSLVSGKQIGVGSFIGRPFSVGSALNSMKSIRGMFIGESKQRQKGNKTNRVGTVPKYTHPITTVQADNFSFVKTVKTIENISQHSYHLSRENVGLIEFEMQVRQRQVVETSIMDNRSALNISQADLRDKIIRQKERMLKEQKKAPKLVKRSIQFMHIPTFTPALKEQLKSAEPVKLKDKYVRQVELLQYLKKRVYKMVDKDALTKVNGTGQITKTEEKQSPTRILHEYYSLRVSLSSQLQVAAERMSPLLYSLSSNRCNKTHNLHQFQIVPNEIIKTQLSEISYNNCFFINFQSLIVQGQYSCKFPSLFYFRLRFWNEGEMRSDVMRVDGDTGQIVLRSGLQDQAKIIHMQVGFDEQTDSFETNFIHFIQYLYNGLLQIQLIDYTTALQFGRFYVPLRGLLRRRRNEVIVIHDDLILHRNLVRAKIKTEIRAIRKVRARTATVLERQEEEPSKLAQKKQNDKLQVDSRLQRIQKFKAEQIQGSKNGAYPNNINRQLPNQMNKKYKTQLKLLKVGFLRKYFFFADAINDSDRPVQYRLAVHDEDQKWIGMNPLSGGSWEIDLVRDPALLQKDDIYLLGNVKKFQGKLARCLKVNSEGMIELQSKSRGTLLLCYLSVRRYRDWREQDSEKLRSFFNRERVVNCSLINDGNGTIESIFALQIIPLPEEASIRMEFYRPCKEKSLVHIPFLDPLYVKHGVDQLLCDDPYLIVHAADESQFSSNQKSSAATGLLLELNSDMPMQTSKQINIIVLSDFSKKEQLLMGDSKKVERFKNKNKGIDKQRDFCANGPTEISVSLFVWGCVQIDAKVQLWKQSEVTFEMKGINCGDEGKKRYFYLFSDAEETVRFYKGQHRKDKNDGYELFRSDGNSKMQVTALVCSSQIGLNYIYINAIDASNILEQDQLHKSNGFSQNVPFKRLVLRIETSAPVFREVLKINISRTSQQSVIDEPFKYGSRCTRKTDFQVMSSESDLVWTKSSDIKFQLQAHGERKISIHFDISRILQRAALELVNPRVVLGVRWEQGVDYFLLKFNIH